ncbi:MAG TPA: hypothetical protein PLG67_10630 [Bacillota bacterium]|jgi:rubredoxin|nr:hypothetical protein [Bacillota bacterium]HQE65839.1 hypothetical protein [Bacillota bacterium]HQJ36581.1 hypothetical protein [Bacillota bacterium]HQL37036.1 hypothetical protein [Bacillota bacterium]
MVIKKFICKNCGFVFERKVFEKGEAEHKRVPAYPIICPKCNSMFIEALK